MIDILKDPKTGITDVMHICHECDISEYPSGKPITDDPGAMKNEKGNWVCSSRIEESTNKMLLRNLGPEHPKVKTFIIAEDKKVLRHNDSAKRLNDGLRRVQELERLSS